MCVVSCVVDRVCIQVDQGMPHQQAQALTVAHNPQKALADCGAASLCFAPWETPVCSRLFHGAKTFFGDYLAERKGCRHEVSF